MDEVVLLVGSHPPVASPAASATVAALRRELARGSHVVTAAPRPAAASLVLPLAGPTAAWRLERARRQTGATRLLMAPEPGLPLRTPPGRLARIPVVAAGWSVIAAPFTLVPLRAVLGRFPSVTLLISDSSPEVRRTARWLRPALRGLLVSGDAAGSDAAAALARVAPGVPIEVVDAAPLGAPLPGVSPLGPPEPLRVRARAAVAHHGRRLLGPVYTPLRLAVVPVEKVVFLARRLVWALRRRTGH